MDILQAWLRRNLHTCSCVSFALSISLLSVSLLSGCGDSEPTIPVYPVRGTVTVGGQSAAGVHLQLHPVDAGLHMFPRTVTDEAGAFQLSTYASNDGVPAGEYVVTASWKQLGDRDQFEKHPDEWTSADEMLDVAVTDPALSPLRVTVVPGKNDLAPLAIDLATDRAVHKKRKGRRE